MVVNGNGVCGHISANMDTDNSTGLDLDLAACIKSNFQLLLNHNIRPLIVFERGFTSEYYEAKGIAKKHIERSLNTTSKVRSVITQLADAVFYSVMKELKLPMLLIKYPDGHKRLHPLLNTIIVLFLVLIQAFFSLTSHMGIYHGIK